MKVAELFVRALEAEGVEYVFGIPGEENLEFMYSLSSSAVKFVLTRDERGAAFMANVYGRLSGRPGVCLSTLGPGATNLITGVADAALDFSPLVAVTAQVALSKIHKESHQYIDVLSLFRPVTKWNTRVVMPETLPEIVRKAFRVASTEKKGPVHIELPEDTAMMHTDAGPVPLQDTVCPSPPEGLLEKAARLIDEAEAPVIIAGNGVVRSGAVAALRRFVKRSLIGVTTTFMGMGVIDSDDECFISTVGLQSRDYISCGFERSDLIITIGYDPVEFHPEYWNPGGGKRIVHINTTAAEVDSRYCGLEIVGDIVTSLDYLAGNISAPKDPSYYRTLRELVICEEDFPEKGYPLKPIRVVKALRSALAGDDIVVSDVGAHKIWLARFLRPSRENTVIISNGLAAMGISVPGAIAAKLLHPGRNVVAVTGDGGLMMSIGELETAKRLGLDIVVLVFNDGGYGLIEWKERISYNREFFTRFGSPDWVKLAESFGFRGLRVDSDDRIDDILGDALSGGGPVLIDCPVDYTENLRLTDILGRLICPM
ncbi:MAG: acetolactate synthase large subunit [Nitrospirae bacterium]|nr:acetolactate synthase large subunit [Nitrospirota bacterium]